MKKYVTFLLLSLLTFMLVTKVAQAEIQPKVALTAKEAFVLKTEVAPNQTVIASWKLAPDYYLYRSKFDFKVLSPKNAKIQAVFPAGIMKKDYEIYKNTLTIPIVVSTTDGTPLKNNKIKLLLRYQGCSEGGFCYPPIREMMQLDLTKVTASLPTNEEKQPLVAEQDRVMNLLMTQGLGVILLGFLGFGLLLAFTPCVLPMLPILSAIIVGQDKEMSTLKALKLSVVYVLGMAINYALIGILAGLLGGHFQEFFQAPIFLITFSILFFILAFSLFGFYELQLPNGLHQRIVQWSNRHEGGTYFGVGVMGFLSTLIVSPCVTAPLVGALGYIGRTGDAVLGGTALFVMGIGMGIPLVVFGTSEGKLLPKAGPWMKDVKAFFGILMLAVAIDLMQRILPDTISIILWGILAIFAGIYLLRFSGISHHRHIKWSRFLGWIPIVYGLLLFVNLSFGIHNMLEPLAFLRTPAVTEAPIAFANIKSKEDLAAALDKSKREGKWVMLDFTAKWCVACQELERTTFSDSKVKALLKNVTLLRIDLTESTKENQALQDTLGVVAPPTILFFNPQAKEEKSLRVVGEVGADDFVQHLNHLK